MTEEILELLRNPRYLKELKVFEGLIRTASLQDTNLILSRKYKIIPNWNKNTFAIIMQGEGEKEFKEMLRTCDNLGWFPSSTTQLDVPSNYRYVDVRMPEYIKLSKNSNLKITFEAKYDIQLHKSKVSKKLFHITSVDKMEKIKKQGLVPKTASKMKNHPDRIYLADTAEHAKGLKRQLMTFTNADKFILIEVDVELLPLYIRFFKDPNFEYGIYTLNNIDPAYLTFHEI